MPIGDGRIGDVRIGDSGVPTILTDPTFIHNGIEYYISIPPAYPFEIGWDDNNIIQTPFEAGYIQSVPRFTRFLKNWKLSYELISDEDRIVFESFFAATRFTAEFQWRNPVDSILYQAQFMLPLPRLIYVFYGFWNTELLLRQK